MSYIWVPETYGVIGATGLIKFGLYVQFDWAFIMNSGGSKLRLTISLTTLFLSISFLLFQSNSFTTAEIRSDIALSIVPENIALLAIAYGEGKQFTITNNTGQTIVLNSVGLIVESINVIKELDNKSDYTLEPGEVKRFNMIGKPQDLNGNLIRIIAHWNGGRTEIKSKIPELKDDQSEDQSKLIDNTIKVPSDLELIEEGQPSLEENGEGTEFDFNEDIVIPESNQEDEDLELNDKQTNPESGEKDTELESDSE